MATINNLLTQEEVDNLPNGTNVNILWSGGNGPGKYVIVKKYGITYVLDSCDLVMGTLDFVGKEDYHTKVWFD